MKKENIFEAARRNADSLAVLLETTNTRIVFAESCTAGLAAALLAGVPGISNWLCGSAVTYREATKNNWLDIDPGLIQQHSAVSEQVTCSMANAVLAKTPEADLAVAITGHLELAVGKNSGICFVGAETRRGDASKRAFFARLALEGDSRIARQWEAADHAITLACAFLSPDSTGTT